MTNPRQKKVRQKGSKPTAASLPKIETILVPVDFSEASKPALRHARSLALLTGAKVCLLHVREMIYTEALMVSVSAFDTSEIREHVEREIGTIQVNEFPDVRTNYEIRDGLPFQEIIALAGKQKADLIVMATHGYTGLKHVLMGSTSERVVRHAPCPVLVVRSHTP